MTALALQSSAFNRSGWVSLPQAAKALAIPQRTATREAEKLRLVGGATKIRGRWLIDPRFWAGLQLALANLAGGDAAPVPEFNVVEWTKNSLRRDAEIRRVLADADAHCESCRHRGMGVTRADANFAAQRGRGYYAVRFSARTLPRWREELKTRGGFPERRGRKEGSLSGGIGPAAWEFFVATVRAHNLKLADAYRITAGKAAESVSDEAWHWTACEATVRNRFNREYPAFYADYDRLGPDKWRAKHLPKMDRRQNELPGNHTWEIDGTDANVLCRYGERTVRPTIVHVYDVATRLMVSVAVGMSESMELIRRALWRAYQKYGAPKLIRSDLGKAFLGEGIGDRSARDKGDESEIVGIIRAMGCETHFTNGRHAWEKGGVEQSFRVDDSQCDRLFKSYIGNNTETRKREADAYARDHHDELPTIEEYERTLAATWDAENVRPRRDFDGLSPLQKFEQTAIPRRVVPKHCEEFLRRRPQRVRVNHRGIGIRIAGEAHYFGQRDSRVWPMQGQRVIAYIDDDDLKDVLVTDLSGRPLFYANNDGLVGLDTDTIREAAKTKKRAAKLRREYMANVDMALAPTADVAVKLRHRAAEIEAAKVAAKLTPVERETVLIATPFGDDLKRVQTQRTVDAAKERTEAPKRLCDLFDVPGGSESAGVRIGELFADAG